MNNNNKIIIKTILNVKKRKMRKDKIDGTIV